MAFQHFAMDDIELRLPLLEFSEGALVASYCFLARHDRLDLLDLLAHLALHHLHGLFVVEHPPPIRSPHKLTVGCSGLLALLLIELVHLVHRNDCYGR